MEVTEDCFLHECIVK